MKKISKSAQDRKDTPIFSGFLMYFPNAVRYVARVSKVGNDQHHPGTPLHWDMTKSTDEADAMARHLVDGGPDGNIFDTDGVLHAGKVAWRSMARLERVLLAMGTLNEHKRDTCDTFGGCSVEECSNYSGKRKCNKL